MTTLKLITAATVLLLWGCGGPNSEGDFNKAQTAYKAALRRTDTLMVPELRPAIFKQALELYESVVKEDPRSAAAESSMFMIATIKNSDTHEPGPALETYKQYVRDYPNGKQLPIAMFMIGFIYNNHFAQYDSAGAAYRRFLEKFPQHEMAMAAQQELNNLGKPPEEWLPKNVAAEQPAQKPQKKTAKKGR